MRMIQQSDAQESEIRTFIREIRQYATIQKSDETVLNRLISRILVGEVKKVDGQKTQEVKIVYNFVGEIWKYECLLFFLQWKAGIKEDLICFSKQLLIIAIMNIWVQNVKSVIILINVLEIIRVKIV